MHPLAAFLNERIDEELAGLDRGAADAAAQLVTRARVVVLHAGTRHCVTGQRYSDSGNDFRPTASYRLWGCPCPTLQALAQIYSGHPKLDPAWLEVD